MSIYVDGGVDGFYLLKNYGFLSIYKDPVLGMIINCPGKHNTLQVPTTANKIIHAVSVGNSDDILFNNGAFVKVFGNIVTRCPDNLYTPFISLFIWIASHKSR